LALLKSRVLDRFATERTVSVRTAGDSRGVPGVAQHPKTAMSRDSRYVNRVPPGLMLSNERAGPPTSSSLRSDVSTKASLGRYRAAVDTALRCPPGSFLLVRSSMLVVEPLIECSHFLFGIRREQVIDSESGGDIRPTWRA